MWHWRAKTKAQGTLRDSTGEKDAAIYWLIDLLMKGLRSTAFACVGRVWVEGINASGGPGEVWMMGWSIEARTHGLKNERTGDHACLGISFRVASFSFRFFSFLLLLLLLLLMLYGKGGGLWNVIWVLRVSTDCDWYLIPDGFPDCIFESFASCSAPFKALALARKYIYIWQHASKVLFSALET